VAAVNGNGFRALQIIGDLTDDLWVEEPTQEQTKPIKAVGEFGGYVGANAGSIPGLGERHRAGEAISAVFVESTVDPVISKRMVTKQHIEMDPTRPALAAPGPHKGPRRRARRRLPPPVLRRHPHRRTHRHRRVTAPASLRSRG
jgi:hypothetical protein